MVITTKYTPRKSDYEMSDIVCDICERPTRILLNIADKNTNILLCKSCISKLVGTIDEHILSDKKTEILVYKD